VERRDFRNEVSSFLCWSGLPIFEDPIKAARAAALSAAAQEAAEAAGGAPAQVEQAEAAQLATEAAAAKVGGKQVSELHKMRLFIYIPWTKYGLLTLFTYTLTGLFINNVFSFYGLSYSMTYDMTPLKGKAVHTHESEPREPAQESEVDLVGSGDQLWGASDR
jgi:hypothetical protein